MTLTLSLVSILFIAVSPELVMAAGCSSGTLAGAVLGTMFATLLVVAVVLAVAYLFWKRKNKGKTSGTKATAGYENAAYQNDVEMVSNKAPHNGMARANDLPAAYVECREYESPKKDRAVVFTKLETKAPTTDPKARRNLINAFDDSNKKNLRLNLSMHKSGSHSSLDGAVTPNEDPEVISVSLQSQDIIGLGFNISGSLSEGIFVSQIHNRGPASESGQVRVGDRILSITISMTNMVYEDALTILSYASPYAVRLRLQRAIPFGHSEQPEDDPSNLSHPVYRSQSLDDLSKINKEKWIGPRKTWSEIKRKHPAKESSGEDGKLRKWMNTDDIVHEEVRVQKAIPISESKSTISNISSSDITEDDVVLTEAEDNVNAQVNSSVSDPDGLTLTTERDEHGGTKRKSVGNSDSGLDINGSSVVTDAPPNKRLRDSISEADVDETSNETNISADNNETKDSVMNGSIEDSVDEKDITVIEITPNGHTADVDEEKEAPVIDGEKKNSSWSSKDSVSSLSDSSSVGSPKENQTDEATQDSKDEDIVIVGDINENKIQLDKELVLSEGQTVSDDVAPQETETNSLKNEDSVRAVLKDYFGDQPTLLEQFGFESGKQGGKVAMNPNDVEVTTVKSSREVETPDEASKNDKEVKVADDDAENNHNAGNRASKDYQYNTGTKSGMAYYLRFDEDNFYNDFGLFNHEFSTQKEQPNLVPVPIGELTNTPGSIGNAASTSVNHSTSGKGTSNMETLNGEVIHVANGDSKTGMEINNVNNDTSA